MVGKNHVRVNPTLRWKVNKKHEGSGKGIMIPDLRLYTAAISLFKFKVALLIPLSPTLNSTNFSSKDIVWKNQVSAQMKCELQFQ